MPCAVVEAAAIFTAKGLVSRDTCAWGQPSTRTTDAYRRWTIIAGLSRVRWNTRNVNTAILLTYNRPEVATNELTGCGNTPNGKWNVNNSFVFFHIIHVRLVCCSSPHSYSINLSAS